MTVSCKPLRGRSFFFLAWLLSCGMGLISAQEAPVQGETNLLPAPTGDAWTLVPKDMRDIDCAVLKWEDRPPVPKLALLCPAQNIFAPLHVYLKLSWLQPADVPSFVHEITAEPRSPTRIRTNKSRAWVWLAVRQKRGAQSHKAWVAFSTVEDLALLTLGRKR